MVTNAPLNCLVILTYACALAVNPDGILDFDEPQQNQLFPPPPDQTSLESTDETPVLPQFIQKMSVDVKAGHGDTIALICQASGYPKPNITWYKSNNQEELIPHRTERLQLNEMHMSATMTNVTLADNDDYSCKVCNILGCIRHTFFVTVGFKETTTIDPNISGMPKLTNLPLNIIRRTGEDLNLRCRPKGAPGIIIRWYKDGAEPKRDVGEIKLNAWMLSIENLTISDSGKYKCETCNSLGCASHIYDVIVNDSLQLEKFSNLSITKMEHINYTLPKIVNPVSPIVARPAGNMVTLRCKGEGNPTPNITWWKNGKNPERDLGTIKYSNWQIILEDLVVRDNANYTCKLCNVVGCVQHSTKLIIIETYHHSPLLHERPKNKTVVVGDSVNLTCNFISDLNPSIYWIKGRVSTLKLNKTVIGSSEVLHLSNITYDQAGFYTCVASNSIGETTAEAYLRVVDSLEEDDANMSWILYLCIALIVAFLVATCIVINFILKLKSEKTKKLIALETARAAVVTQWTKRVTIEKNPNVEDGEEGLSMPVVKITQEQRTQNNNTDDGLLFVYELPMDADWEIPRELLTLGKSLGEGAFGKVIKADAVGLTCPIVAVKMLKDGHTDNEMMDLVSEMHMMKMIGKHINIINLLGCCTQNGPLFVVVEFAPHGNLRDFLRQHRPSSGYEPAIGMEEKERKSLTQKDLACFAYQVARGMEYLASRRCIHRDLAARNVLVSEDFVLKIADFGLARDIHCNDYYRKNTDGRLPVKWMAPEALFHRVYTTQSDVWSFGVLLWEIMTLGGTPYPSVPSVEKLFQLLRSGHRMEKPNLCSMDIYMQMRECWTYNPKQRPYFSELVEELDRILTITANEEYLDLGLPQLDTPPSSQEEITTDEEDDEDEEEQVPFVPCSHHGNYVR